jgi:hypothetical protein
VDLPRHGIVELRLSGGRTGPDASAAELGESLVRRYEGLVPEIEKALHRHYSGYRYAAERGDRVPAPFPVIENAGDVWSHVRLASVLIAPLDGIPTVEIVLSASWDQEHTLGARLRDWRLLELCGSV